MGHLVRALRTVPCSTCGLMPTDIFADGSPRFAHGHDPVTGAVWWRTRQEDATARLCPACRHEHPAGTTCLQCPVCRAGDLTDLARDIFADLLPGGIDATEALARHDRDLGRHAACDGSCGLPGCRAPCFDAGGLTCYRDVADGPATSQIDEDKEARRSKEQP